MTYLDKDIPLDPKTELVWIHRDDVHWETENGWLIEANIFDEAWRFSLSTAGADYRFRQGYGSRSTLEAAQRLAQNLQNVFDDVGSVPVLETPSNDLISRQAVEQWAIADFNEELLGFLKTLSPVEPVPPDITSQIIASLKASIIAVEQGIYVFRDEKRYEMKGELHGYRMALAMVQDLISAAVEPVPAPRLEWERIENCDRECSQTPHLRGAQFKVHHNGTFVTMTFSGSLDLPTDDAAKSLAEKLNAVLSPPVGTQPTKGN